MPVLDFNIAIEKQPSEQLTYRFELANIFESLVISGYGLSAAEVKIFDSTGMDVTASMVLGVPSIDDVNKYIFVTIIAGTDGNDYFGRIKTTWTKASAPDQKPECDFLIRIRQKGF